jgi:hypothetical protein
MCEAAGNPLGFPSAADNLLYSHDKCEEQAAAFVLSVLSSIALTDAKRVQCALACIVYAVPPLGVITSNDDRPAMLAIVPVI